jgi:hypothetical protein
MKTELIFLTSDSKNETEMIEVIHRWEDEAFFIPGKERT